MQKLKPEKDLSVLVCNDEVHVLLPPPQVKGTKREDTVYNYFLQAINEFSGYPVFFILLSTQPRISSLTLSSNVATSARYIASPEHPSAPLTETPFDCHVETDFDGVTVDMLSDITFLSQYGRPL